VDFLPVRVGTAAVGNLFHPVAESTHELTVVVRVAGREIELAGLMAPVGQAATHSLHSRHEL
jgi:hypothetical protein